MPTHEDQIILNHVVDLYMALKDKWETKRADSEQTFKKLKGGDDSWDSDILEDLRAKKLPHLNLNIMLPIMQRIFGAESNQRGKLKAIPLNDASNQAAQVWTNLFDVVESHYHTMEQFGQAFKQAVVCDLPGIVRLKWSFTKDPLGMPEPEYLNCFYVMFGEHSKKDLSDCREIIISWFVSREEIIDEFPDKADEIQKYFKETRQSVPRRIRDSIGRMFGSEKIKAAQEMLDRAGLIRVMELYERNTDTEYAYKDESDPWEGPDLVKIPKDRLEEFKRDKPNAVILKKRRDIMTITTTLGDQVVLQKKTPLPIQNGKYPIFPVWGINIDDDNIGIGRQLEGPLDEYQKSRSSELHILGLMANAGWTYEDGSLSPEEERKLQRSGGSMGLLLKFEAGKQKPEKIQPTVPPAGMQGRSLQAKEDMHFISGVGPNPMGRKESASESGKLFQSKVEEFLSMLAEFFLNKKHAEEWAGDYMIDMFRFFVGNEERDFTNSETGERITINETVPLAPGIRLRDIQKGQFAARSEVAPSTLTARREIANILLQTLQYTKQPELQPVILKLLFEKLELPEEDRLEMVEAAKRLIPPSPEDELNAAATIEEFAGNSGAPVEPLEV